MKTIKFIFILLMSVIALSCNDWLEVDPGSNLATKNFYNSPAEVEQALVGVYNGLLPLAEYSWMMSEIRSDNIWTESFTGAQRDYVDICTYNLNIIGINTIHNAWVNLYKIVARSNTLLENMQDVDFDYTTEFDIKSIFEAEARLLRAYAYFELVRYYGRVPIVLAPQSISEAMATPQSEDLEVYERVIIPDLKFAVEHLQEQAYDYQGKVITAARANVITARALLGRVYLTMSGFPIYDSSKADLAADLLEQVIDYADLSGKYWAKTGEEWKHIWISDNDNKYHIFEIQYLAESGYGNTMVYYTTPRVPVEYISLNMSNYSLAVSSDLQDILKTDINGDGLFDDVRCLATIDTTRLRQADGTRFTTFDFFIKFFEHKMKRSALGYSDIDGQFIDRNYFPINYPIIRLEDVMLMYAEIVGPTTKGIEMVNRIRTRAGLGALTDAQIADFSSMVELERRRELAGEGIRWHDLVRHNRHISAIKNKFIQYATDENGNITRPTVYALTNRVIDGVHLYPIPDTQMKAKEGLYQQNQAYR